MGALALLSEAIADETMIHINVARVLWQAL